MADDPKAAPSEQKTVPYDRFKEVNDAKKTADAEKLRAQKDADYWKEQAQKKTEIAEPKPEPKTIYTKEQLEKLVTENKMTSQEAQSILDDQFLQRTTEAAADTARQTVREEIQATKMSTQFDQFRETHPEAWQPGSEKYERVKGRYAELVADGMPKTEATELVALKIEFGAPKPPRIVPPETTFQGGVGDANLYESEPVERSDGIPAKLAETMTSRQKAWYSDLVARDQYTWKDVEAEMEYSDPAKAKKADMLFGKPKKRA